MKKRDSALPLFDDAPITDKQAIGLNKLSAVHHRLYPDGHAEILDSSGNALLKHKVALNSWPCTGTRS